MIIAFEGIDGSGKTTQAKLLAEVTGYKYFHAPGSDTEVAKMIKAQLRSQTLSDRTMTMLFMADMCELIDNEIAPALQDGRSVIVDRYQESMIVYLQDGWGRKAFERWVDEIVYPYDPSWTVLLDLGVDAARHRIADPDSIESDTDRLEAARRGYLNRLFEYTIMTPLERLEEDLGSWEHIDASLRPEEIHEEIVEAHNARFSAQFTPMSRPQVRQRMAAR